MLLISRADQKTFIDFPPVPLEGLHRFSTALSAKTLAAAMPVEKLAFVLVDCGVDCAVVSGHAKSALAEADKASSLES